MPWRKKQQTLLIILLTFTANGGFRIEHIVSPAKGLRHRIQIATACVRSLRAVAKRSLKRGSSQRPLGTTMSPETKREASIKAKLQADTCDRFKSHSAVNAGRLKKQLLWARGRREE